MESAVQTSEPIPTNYPIKHNFKFYGKGSEYFRIWIVNISLTILTLGIYSAWAKVRNLNYFYGNTEVVGSRFHYHASPIAILKGRLLVFGFFVMYMLISNYYPVTGILFSLLFLFLMPTLIVRSLRFTARNSSYRGVRFDFNGSIWGAIKYFILFPMLVPLTLGLIFPYMLHQQQKYVVENAYYGKEKFIFNNNVKAFYGICLKASLFVIVFMFLMGGTMEEVGPRTMDVDPETGEPIMNWVFGLMMAIMMAFMTVLQGYFHALLMNARYKQTQLGKAGEGESGFESSLSAVKLSWIYLSNIVLILGTLGLAIPWTKMRLMNYRVECLVLKEGQSFNTILAAEQEAQSALGEEAGDAMDLDFAL